MISLENVTVKHGRKLLLENITADFSEAECWVITGSNGSGKSVLGKVIGGIITPCKGSVNGSAVTGYTSFELQEKIMEAEKKKDESRLMHGAVDEGTSVCDFLSVENYPDPDFAAELINLFSVSSIMKRGLKFLSTGEFRKVLLLSALLKKPDLLVIDDPFDGLDFQAREHLADVISRLIKKGCYLVLITGRIEDFPDEAERMILLSDGVLKFSGEIEKGKALYRKTHMTEDADKDAAAEKGDLFASPLFSGKSDLGEKQLQDILIDMNNVTVSYSGRNIIDSFSWRVMRGEKWKITGVNGAGKSTLLSLVNGDNPQSYANDITLFGRKRGTGESIWDIKKKIGFVSGDFQFRYRVRCTVLDAVISGLFDSIGIYNEINESDIEKGRRWLKFAGLYSRRGNLFTDLSFGEMRLALIARAMIKDPELLVLDEPCQGLDSFNRERVISLCEEIGKEENHTILFVTHDIGINLKCFTNFLVIEKKQ